VASSGMKVLPPIDLVELHRFMENTRISRDARLKGEPWSLLDHARPEELDLFRAARQTRQAQTLQRLIDAIVWEWDNPYSDPGSSGWVPLSPGEDEG
jgi:hypothetical protein